MSGINSVNYGINLINMTPHPVTLRGEWGEITIQPSGQVVRAQAITHHVASLYLDDEAGFIPVVEITYGEPEGLPDLEPNTFYIVSWIAAQAIRKHHPEIADRFLVPSNLVWDEQGRIVAARALARISC